MPFVDGSGHAFGVGAAHAVGVLRYGARGLSAGVGVAVGRGALRFGPLGHAAGLATGLSHGTLHGVFAGHAFGLATVHGDYRVNASGHAFGVGAATGHGFIIYHGVGHAQGTSGGTARGGRLLIFTGQAHGLGRMSFDQFIDSPGAAHGFATVSGAGQRIILARGFIFGTSKMTFSYPLPIFGKGTLVGYPVVDRVLPAINSIVGPTKCFRYLDHFQRGDLPIFISTCAGPVTPVRVSFTLFQLRPDGSRIQAGPACRKPVSGVVGEFYATGRAGESGQPGQWIIRWEFQQTFQSAIQVKEMCFQVLDAVAARDPRDVTQRCRKFGWN